MRTMSARTVWLFPTYLLTLCVDLVGRRLGTLQVEGGSSRAAFATSIRKYRCDFAMPESVPQVPQSDQCPNQHCNRMPIR